VFCSYSRDSDNILGSLKAKWHDNEFIEGEMKIQKYYESLSEFGVKSQIDVSSSFRGMTSLHASVEVDRNVGAFESSALIKVT